LLFRGRHCACHDAMTPCQAMSLLPRPLCMLWEVVLPNGSGCAVVCAACCWWGMVRGERARMASCELSTRVVKDVKTPRSTTPHTNSQRSMGSATWSQIPSHAWRGEDDGDDERGYEESIRWGQHCKVAESCLIRAMRAASGISRLYMILIKTMIGRLIEASMYD